MEELAPTQAPESADTTQPAEPDAPVADVKFDEPPLPLQEALHKAALEQQGAVDPIDASLTSTILESDPAMLSETDHDTSYPTTEAVNVISSIPHIEPLKTGDEETSDGGVDLPAVPLVDAEFTQPSDESDHIIIPVSEEEPEHHEDDEAEAVSLHETLEAQHLPPTIEHALEIGSTPSVEALLDAVQHTESANEDDVATKSTPPAIDVALAETFAGADDLPTAIETAFETGLAPSPEALLNAVQATLSATVFASGAPSPSDEKKEDALGFAATPRSLDEAQREEPLEDEAKDSSPGTPNLRS